MQIAGRSGAGSCDATAQAGPWSDRAPAGCGVVHLAGLPKLTTAARPGTRESDRAAISGRGDDVAIAARSTDVGDAPEGDLDRIMDFPRRRTSRR